MPVPSHLVDCVVPKESVIDERPLDANVRCTCGSHQMELFFPGQTTQYRGETIACTAEVDGKFFFLVKAQCAHCKKQHLLLDIDFHGWNGFVFHDPKQAAVPRPVLIPWNCLACGNVVHEASIQVQTEGKEDFVSGGCSKFPEERWPDGFAWITIGILCASCGKQTPEWVSYETM